MFIMVKQVVHLGASPGDEDMQKSHVCISYDSIRPEATGTTPPGQGVGMAQTVSQGRE